MLNDEIIFGQPSWVMQSDAVRMCVTHCGAQMGPVYFRLDEAASVQPYHVAPWHAEDHPELHGRSEGPLRGDFFCLPFGYAEPSLGLPSHGRSAGGRWSLSSSETLDGIHELNLSLNDALDSAQISRKFLLRDGESVVYDETVISGLAGAYTLGHHAVLRLPAQGAPLLLSTSTQRFGMTHPREPDGPAEKSPRHLAVGATFDDLDSVPSLREPADTVDCSTYPFLVTSSDVLQIAVETEPGQPAWTVAVNPAEGYLWFSLRNIDLLPCTLVWMEDGGRQETPWRGRNHSIGLEDVCSYFDTGSEVSRLSNAFSKRGIETVHHFSTDTPVRIPYIQGVVSVPEEFTHVKSVRCDEGQCTFTDRCGIKASCRVSTDFLRGFSPAYKTPSRKGL